MAAAPLGHWSSLFRAFLDFRGFLPAGAPAVDRRPTERRPRPGRCCRLWHSALTKEGNYTDQPQPDGYLGA